MSDDTSFTSQSESCYAAACDYIARGWAVIPVHSIKPGTKRCTCGEYPCQRDNSGAGKHPVGRKWTKKEGLSTADAYSVWMESKAPRNVGILTGNPSGVFALDVDPRHGGDAALEKLIFDNGQLPPTLTMRTGSGGRHYIFIMPPDQPITNSAKRLPPGIDVRGTGGMIVAPPSVSLAGTYEVLDDRPPVPAPRWLLRLLVLSEGGYTTPPIENLPVYSDLDADEQRRLERYARCVVEQEAENYAKAPPGTGNQQLFEAACNCIEVAQSPWNLVTVEEVRCALDDARRRRLSTREEGGQSDREFEATFSSAWSRKVGHGREIPPKPEERDLGFEDPSLGVRKTENQPGAEEENEDLDPVEALLAEMLSAAEIRKLPPPRPLIHGLLNFDSEAWIIGAPGSFKSFVALDMAAHVGTGKRWQDRLTEQGEVVYVVAEGVSGMGPRVQAWETLHGEMSGVRFLPRPVQAKNGKDWRVLVEACARIKPALVILDTQARITLGLEENSATEMGYFIERVRQLREATGACILVVHHLGRHGGDARGSSALDGAQTTELKVEREAHNYTTKLTSPKQKDMSDDFEILLKLETVELGVDAQTRDKINSLAIAEADTWETPTESRPWIEELPRNEGRISTVLTDHGDRDLGNTIAEVRAWIAERFGPMSKSSFYTALNNLKDKGIVIHKTTARVALEDPPLS